MHLQTGMVQEVKHSKPAVKSWLILSMCLVYLVQFFASFYFLQLFTASLAMAVFLISLSSARPAPRFFGFGMVLTGIILNVLKGDGVEGMTDGIITNLPLLTLVILVPLISIPLKIGGYFDSIHFFMEMIANDFKKMFSSITLFIFCLGPILNLGSIRVLHEMIQDLKLPPVLLAKSYLSGFSTVILWSPYFASVAMVLYYLQVPVLDYIPLGLSLGFVQLVVGNLLFRLWYRRHGGEPEALGNKNKKWPNDVQGLLGVVHHRKKIKKLMAIVLGLFAVIFFIEYLTKLSMLVLVSLTSIIFPIFWSAATQKWRQSNEYFQSFKVQSVPTMSNEIVMFIGAGIFGKALVGTPVAAGIKLFLHRASELSFWLFIITVLFSIILFTFMGVHQIVIVTVLITQMDPAAIGTEPRVIALLMMVGWSISAVLSPVNPLNLLVSSSANQPSLRIGLRWNGAYLAAMFVIGAVYVYLLH